MIWSRSGNVFGTVIIPHIFQRITYNAHFVWIMEHIFDRKNLHMYVIFQDRKKKENHVMRMEKWVLCEIIHLLDACSLLITWGFFTVSQTLIAIMQNIQACPWTNFAPKNNLHCNFHEIMGLKWNESACNYIGGRLDYA